uniref:Globin family profile domain-containing protein n=1 Tax=Globodera rostochiensis TaxID=31243 RepID=A0A914HAJ9_GLORO
MGNSCMIPASQTAPSSISGSAVAFTRPIDAKLYRKGGLKKKEAPEMQIMYPETMLTPRDRELINLCWHNHIVTERRDLFHKTMLYCIEASPKINEIIACNRYCYRDLTKWPKLDRICQAQFNFFEKLINEYELDEDRMFDACVQLGEMHANYAQYGLKPHFLDIFQQQLLGIIARLEIDDKVETCIAFTHLVSFVVDVMIQAYSKKASNIRTVTR